MMVSIKINPNKMVFNNMDKALYLSAHTSLFKYWIVVNIFKAVRITTK
jgi:hypothetical protein